jgi:hypothetical protein
MSVLEGEGKAVNLMTDERTQLVDRLNRRVRRSKADPTGRFTGSTAAAYPASKWFDEMIAAARVGGSKYPRDEIADARE